MQKKMLSVLKKIEKIFTQLRPGTALVTYYTFSIFFGAILLSTPFATVSGKTSFIDALFTATSAQCVTGLSVVDVGSHYTLFGQLVILVLIQLGGWGIMTFSLFLFMFLKKSISTNGRVIIQETLMHTPVKSWKILVQRVIKITLLVESIGALLLSAIFIPEYGFVRGIYYSIFHSISAFCNAGFSLFPDSLESYSSSIIVNGVIGFQIILGGLGFLAISEIYESIIKNRERMSSLSLHTKIVTITTITLVLSGALALFIFEYSGAFQHLPLYEKIIVSFFQSITTRTAGFNTFDFGLFSAPTLMLTMLLMFIGASPGSSGGGVKTTTLAIFILTLKNRFKGNNKLNVFYRTIPEETVIKTLVLTILSIGIIAVSLLGILIAQQNTSATSNIFINHLFEVISALATVGLTLGTTSELTFAGKLFIIFLMFLGRVGLLTVAFTIARRERPNQQTYAEENIMIG